MTHIATKGRVYVDALHAAFAIFFHDGLDAQWLNDAMYEDATPDAICHGVTVAIDVEGVSRSVRHFFADSVEIKVRPPPVAHDHNPIGRCERRLDQGICGRSES